jgi:hypothetical protein
MIRTPAEAAMILSASLHRGAASWIYDPECRRVVPEAWDLREGGDVPAFTAFEAVAVARGLMALYHQAQPGAVLARRRGR